MGFPKTDIPTENSKSSAHQEHSVAFAKSLNLISADSVIYFSSLRSKLYLLFSQGLIESISSRANKHLWEEVAGSIPALPADKGCFGDPATLSSPADSTYAVVHGQMSDPGPGDRASRLSDLNLGFRLSRGCQCG